MHLTQGCMQLMILLIWAWLKGSRKLLRSLSCDILGLWVNQIMTKGKKKFDNSIKKFNY